MTANFTIDNINTLCMVIRLTSPFSCPRQKIFLSCDNVKLVPTSPRTRATINPDLMYHEVGLDVG